LVHDGGSPKVQYWLVLFKYRVTALLGGNLCYILQQQHDLLAHSSVSCIYWQ